jgi:hypothetical protein
MREDFKTPGAYAVQFVCDTPTGLDFHAHDAPSFGEALILANETVIAHPDFQWEGVLIWKDRTAADIRKLNEQLQRELDSDTN